MEFDPNGKENLLLTDSNIINRYIHAGKGELVLQGPSGKAHKYMFLSPKDSSNFPEDTIFVYVVHNEKRYYLGMLQESEPWFRRTAKSSFGEDTEAVKGARYICKMANRQDLVDKTPMKLYQSGKCCKCGRTLTAESEIHEGIGKKCFKKYKLLQEQIPWDGNAEPM